MKNIAGTLIGIGLAIVFIAWFYHAISSLANQEADMKKAGYSMEVLKNVEIDNALFDRVVLRSKYHNSLDTVLLQIDKTAIYYSGNYGYRLPNWSDSVCTCKPNFISFIYFREKYGQDPNIGTLKDLIPF